MKGWFAAHANAAGDALGRLAATPLGSLLALFAIGIALALPTGLLVVLDNVQTLARELVRSHEISVFLAPDASQAEVAEIDRRLREAAAGEFRFVAKAAALKHLQEKSGAGDLIAGLPKNPLPDAFVVRPKAGVAEFDALAQKFARWPKVAHVQVDTAWATRLDAALRLGRQAALIFSAVLAAGLIAVVFNTIRLQLVARQEEIEVALLIGATRDFVARPFLWLGLIEGLVGGAIAAVLVGGALALVAGPAAELFALYGSGLGLRTLTPTGAAGVLAAGGGLGWLGAWLSTQNLSRLDLGE